VVFRDEGPYRSDSKEKIIHTVKVSAANVADSLALPHLLHGKRLGCTEIRRTAVKECDSQTAPRRRTSSINATRYNGQIDETERRKNRPSRRSAPSGASPSG